MEVSTRPKTYLPAGGTRACMLQAELEVCRDCGNVHMEGGAGPDDVDECAVCGERVDEVEFDDLISF